MKAGPATIPKDIIRIAADIAVNKQRLRKAVSKFLRSKKDRAFFIGGAK